MRAPRRALAGLACAALLASAQARAEATVELVRGELRADGERVSEGRRVQPGSTLATGPGAQAYLRFSDRQRVALDENTTFKVVEFHYSAHVPHSDRATFELARGAVRVVSGAVGARNPGRFALRTPHATFGLRGTDFVVVLTNWSYLKVLGGGVSVTNAGGTVIFGADTAAVVTADSAIAAPVFAAALPPVASGPMARLARLPEEGSTRAPTQAAAGAAAGGASALPDAGTLAKLGLYAALIAAALRGTDSASGH